MSDTTTTGSDMTPADDPATVAGITADDDWTPEPRYTPGTADMILASQRAAESRQRETDEAKRPTGTETGQITAKLRELTGQLREQQTRLADLVSFLTGSRGFASNAATWSNGNDNGDHTDFTFADYDPAYDAHVDFEGPESGIISIDLAAWINVKANAYSTDQSDAYGVNVRAGVSFDIIDSGGAMAYAARQVDSAQLTTEAWGVNNANVVGATTSNTATVSGLTPGRNYTLRTRRGRYGYAHDGDSNPIAMPDKGWWRVTISSQRANVVLVAGANINDQTPDDDGTQQSGGSS